MSSVYKDGESGFHKNTEEDLGKIVCPMSGCTEEEKSE